jgi:hypothetical protein
MNRRDFLASSGALLGSHALLHAVPGSRFGRSIDKAHTHYALRIAPGGVVDTIAYMQFIKYVG